MENKSGKDIISKKCRLKKCIYRIRNGTNKTSFIRRLDSSRIDHRSNIPPHFYRKGFPHFFTVHSCDRATDRILSGQRSTSLPRREWTYRLTSAARCLFDHRLMAQMARTRLAQLLRPEHVTLWLELALKSIERRKTEINRINRIIFPF